MRKSLVRSPSALIFLGMILLSLFAECISFSRPWFAFNQGRFVFDFKDEAKNESFTRIFPLILWGPTQRNPKVEAYPSPPTSENFLGTDSAGRDLLSRLLYGFRVSILFGFLSCAFAFFIGAILGMILGYSGGVADLIGARIAEWIEQIPAILILIVLGSQWEIGFWSLIGIAGVLGWPSIFFLVRNRVVMMKSETHLLGAESLGVHSKRVLLKHVLPFSIQPVWAMFPLAVANQMGNLAVLDYLGMGFSLKQASLGELLSDGQRHFLNAPWILASSVAVVTLTCWLLLKLTSQLRSKEI